MWVCVYMYTYIHSHFWVYKCLFLMRKKKGWYLINIFKFAALLNTGVYLYNGKETERNAIWS